MEQTEILSWISMRPQTRNDFAVEAQKQITAPLRVVRVAESPNLCPPKISHISKLRNLLERTNVGHDSLRSLKNKNEQPLLRLNPDSPIVHPTV